MTVGCPRCGTRYRLPPRSKLGSDPTYRCVQCRHVFAADAAAEEPAVVDEAEPDADIDEVELDEDTEDPERFSFADEDEDDDEDDEPAAPEPPRARERRRDAAPRPKRAADDGAKPTPMSGVGLFALRTVFGVTLTYAVASIYLYTHPADVAAVMARVPLIGGPLAEKRLSPAAVQLSNVKGSYERVRGDKLVFVISGTATNNATSAVKGVQIEGRIVGREEQRQVVFCGAAPRDVQDLSVREIALLQSLEPPKDWTLGAGEQANFLVAFVTPPAELREFSAEVVGVQAPTRGAART